MLRLLQLWWIALQTDQAQQALQICSAAPAGWQSRLLSLRSMSSVSLSKQLPCLAAARQHNSAYTSSTCLPEQLKQQRTAGSALLLTLCSAPLLCALIVADFLGCLGSVSTCKERPAEDSGPCAAPADVLSSCASCSALCKHMDQVLKLPLEQSAPTRCAQQRIAGPALLQTCLCAARLALRPVGTRVACSEVMSSGCLRSVSTCEERPAEDSGPCAAPDVLSRCCCCCCCCCCWVSRSAFCGKAVGAGCSAVGVEAAGAGKPASGTAQRACESTLRRRCTFCILPSGDSCMPQRQVSCLKAFLRLNDSFGQRLSCWRGSCGGGEARLGNGTARLREHSPQALHLLHLSGDSCRPKQRVSTAFK